MSSPLLLASTTRVHAPINAGHRLCRLDVLAASDRCICFSAGESVLHRRSLNHSHCEALGPLSCKLSTLLPSPARICITDNLGRVSIFCTHRKDFPTYFASVRPSGLSEKETEREEIDQPEPKNPAPSASPKICPYHSEISKNSPDSEIRDSLPLHQATFVTCVLSPFLRYVSFEGVGVDMQAVNGHTTCPVSSYPGPESHEAQ